MKKEKPWLGVFEEQLYEKFTSPIKLNHRNNKNRICLRCEKPFRTKESYTCNSCKALNKGEENDS